MLVNRIDSLDSRIHSQMVEMKNVITQNHDDPDQQQKFLFLNAELISLSIERINLQRNLIEARKGM